MIIELNKNLEAAWQKYVDNSNKTNFTHTLEIREVIKNSYGFKDNYLLSIGENNIIDGILPLFKVSKNKFLSLPFFDYAGLVTENDQVIKEFDNYLDNHYINLNKTVELRQLKKYGISNYLLNEDYVTSIIKLPTNSAVLWKLIDKKARNQIRKAEKFKPRFLTGQEYLNDFYQLYLKKMKSHGTPGHSLNFFKNLLITYKNANIFICQYNKQVVAALTCINFKDKSYLPWAASLDFYSSYNFNNFLYWQTLVHLINKKMKIADLGRSQKNSSVLNFKKQWHTNEQILSYYKIGKKLKKFISPQKSKLKYIAKLYSLLPLSLTKYLGPKLRKYLP